MALRVYPGLMAAMWALAGPNQMLLFFRLSFGVWCAAALHRTNDAFAARLQRLWKGVHDRLRDDKYLIGRQLHNHEVQA